VIQQRKRNARIDLFGKILGHGSHMIQVLNVVTCHVCRQSNELKLLKNEKRFDQAFLSWEFNNFYKGPNRFGQHEISACHREAVLNLANTSIIASINTTISDIYHLHYMIIS